MNKALEVLKEYCELHQIELSNMEEVAQMIDLGIESVVAHHVQEFGVIVEGD